MVFRFLFRILMNEKVINKLADSYPFRRTAKWVVYFIHKAKYIQEDKISLKGTNFSILLKASERFISFLNRIQSIKPAGHPSSKDQDQVASKFNNFVERNESGQSLSNTKKPETQNNKAAEERLRNYVEELKKRTKQ